MRSSSEKKRLKIYFKIIYSIQEFMNLKTLFKHQGMHMSGLYKGKFMY